MDTTRKSTHSATLYLNDGGSIEAVIRAHKIAVAVMELLASYSMTASAQVTEILRHERARRTERNRLVAQWPVSVSGATVTLEADDAGRDAEVILAYVASVVR